MTTLFVFLDRIFTCANSPFQNYLGPRRPSCERRAVSWTVTKQEGPYDGQGQFFLPRNFSTPVMAKTKLNNPGSADTSESSDPEPTWKLPFFLLIVVMIFTLVSIAMFDSCLVSSSSCLNLLYICLLFSRCRICFFLSLLSACIVCYLLSFVVNKYVMCFLIFSASSSVVINHERVHLALVAYRLVRMAWPMDSPFIRPTMPGYSALFATSHSRTILCSGMLLLGIITYG